MDPHPEHELLGWCERQRDPRAESALEGNFGCVREVARGPRGRRVGIGPETTAAVEPAVVTSVCGLEHGTHPDPWPQRLGHACEGRAAAMEQRDRDLLGTWGPNQLKYRSVHAREEPVHDERKERPAVGCRVDDGQVLL